MAKKSNVSRLPARLDAVEQSAAEPVQAAVRDYVRARHRLDEQLAQVDTLLERGAADIIAQHTAALGEVLIATHSSLVRLATTLDVGHGTVDPAVLSTSFADTAAASGARAERQSAPTPANEAAILSSVESLTELGADSIVIQSPATASGRPRPYQRGDDGQWHSHTIGRGGISSDSLWNGGGDLVVILRTERPVTAGTTAAQRVAAEARFRAWQVHDDDHGHLRLTRSEIAIDLRYSTATGSITKATRTDPDGRVGHAAAVGKLGTVLRWLKEDR